VTVVMTHRSGRMGGYRHKVAAHAGPTDLVTPAHRFGAVGSRVAGDGEFRPTSERALAPGRPSVIEVPANHRDDLAPV
jgi:thiamine pyrophosphate-dependent acetolactate synthase large subunit-like protein